MWETLYPKMLYHTATLSTSTYVLRCYRCRVDNECPEPHEPPSFSSVCEERMLQDIVDEVIVQAVWIARTISASRNM